MSGELPEELQIAKELGLAEIVPEVYKDLLQPATKEFGKGLEITAKAITLALAPIQGMVWGADQIKNYLTVSITKRLRNLPTEQIITPNPSVAGPTIEALKFNGHNPHLRELFANLLAASIDAEQAAKAHPAFVEIIKQINPDEAKIINYFSSKKDFPTLFISHSSGTEIAYHKPEDVINDFLGIIELLELDNPDLARSYIDNFFRLQLIERFDEDNKDELDHMYGNSNLSSNMKSSINFRRRLTHTIVFTKLGQQFIETCVNPSF
ncbi:MAG: DUF4393 domain-containing protein [Gammaproteobacteria bacterium]|nr:DUF4393 domain-containing protein [Gammaproteobacteria bacterium]